MYFENLMKNIYSKSKLTEKESNLMMIIVTIMQGFPA